MIEINHNIRIHAKHKYTRKSYTKSTPGLFNADTSVLCGKNGKFLRLSSTE